MKTRKVQISKARKMSYDNNVLRAWQRMHWQDGVALIHTPLIGACCNKYTNQFLQVDMIQMLKTWLGTEIKEVEFAKQTAYQSLDADFDGWERREEEILRRGF